ncbi:MAG: SPFH domain-containing protein [Planctomycetota bacterium]|jgi:membrane protease subunit HflK
MTAEDKNIPENQENYDPAAESLSEALSIGLFLLKTLMILVICAFFVLGCFYVDESRAVLVRRFGEYTKNAEGTVRIYEPGRLYYAIPIVDQVEEIDMREQKINIDVEFNPAKGNLSAEMNNVVKEKLLPGADGYAITGDMNIIHTTWQINYRISDPYRYKTAFQEKGTGTYNLQTGSEIFRGGAEQLLIEIFLNTVIRITAGLPVDDALKSSENYERLVTKSVIDRIKYYSCGITVTGINLKKAEPPKKAVSAFTDVINSRTESKKKESTAKGKAQELIKDADGEAKKIVNSAEVYRQKVISSARSDAENIKELLAKFPHDEKGLNIYLKQYHSEVLAEVLEKSRPFVVRQGATWYISKQSAYNEMMQDLK